MHSSLVAPICKYSHPILKPVPTKAAENLPEYITAAGKAENLSETWQSLASDLHTT